MELSIRFGIAIPFHADAMEPLARKEAGARNAIIAAASGMREFAGR
jgi:hypothetical protein